MDSSNNMPGKYKAQDLLGNIRNDKGDLTFFAIQDWVKWRSGWGIWLRSP
jgi:hypothetical protein